MLRRCPGRGGFWQGVTGAPLPGETDAEAAAREVLEETGFDVAAGLFGVGGAYSYALAAESAARWEEVYGPGIQTVTVATFAAELSAGEPVLDPREHDAFAWLSYEQASVLLDWPVEPDALAARRAALSLLHTLLRGEE